MLAMQISRTQAALAPSGDVSEQGTATDVPEADRSVCLLESALRILTSCPRLGDSWQRAEWLRLIEQDRAALRGFGRLA